MLKNLLFVIASVCAVNASADQVTDGFAKALGRNLTIEEVQNVQQVKQIASQFADRAVIEQIADGPQALTMYVACLSVKGAVVFANSQQMACLGTDGIYTISKNLPPSLTVDNLSLSAEAGVIVGRIAATPNANSRIQSFELLEEPVTSINIDGAWLGGGQVALFSSKNVSVQLFGLVAGYGGGLNLEQNGDVPREGFDGSTLNIQKFNLF